MSSSTVIVKNTAVLYFRMLFIIVVSLYTSRVVLRILGVEDFGIYDLVGGIVAMLGFLNNSLTTSTQRFLNVGMVKKEGHSLNEIFSTSVIGHLIIAGIIFVLAETVGLYLVLEKLTIPAGRMTAALWVYQFSILTFILRILRTPYNAMVFAYEKMQIFGYFSIIEALLGLGIVFILPLFSFDKLIFYGILMFLVSALITLAYCVYCWKRFDESRVKFQWHGKLFKEMFSFSGWILAGTASNVLSTQGTNMLINIFFGPVYNASRAIAFKVSVAIRSFVDNITLAVRPQITKSYSEGNFDYAYRLTFASSRISFCVMFTLMLPVILFTEKILGIWLGIVPAYSVIFTQLVLVDSIISSLFAPIGMISQASGKLKLYQIVVTATFTLAFLLTYLFYKLGYPAETTFIIAIIISVASLILRLMVIKRVVNFPVREYSYNVILPLVGVVFFSLLPPLIVYWFDGVENGFGWWMLPVSVIVTSLVSWLLGVRPEEKRYLIDKVKSRFFKNRKVNP